MYLSTVPVNENPYRTTNCIDKQKNFSLFYCLHMACNNLEVVNVNFFHTLKHRDFNA